MSATPQTIAALRNEYESAKTLLNEAEAQKVSAETKAGREEAEATATKAKALADRLPTATANPKSGFVSASDVLEAELTAAAAKQASSACQQRVQRAAVAFKKADAALSGEIAAFASQRESEEGKALLAHLEAIAPIAARMIAAANVARNHGDKRLSRDWLDVEDWFGAAGSFVTRLGAMDWSGLFLPELKPTWVNCFNATKLPTKLTGVAEAEAELLSLIGGDR